MTDPTGTISVVCSLLDEGRSSEAAATLQEEYPFVRIQTVERKYADADALRVFVRDGFVDRYSGRRLVFPGALLMM